MSTETHVIHSFVKRPGEKIQVVLRRYNGKYYADLRLWFQQGPGQNFLPSRKGISFELEHLSEFRRGVEQLAQAVANLQGAGEGRPSTPPKQTSRFNKLYTNPRSE